MIVVFEALVCLGSLRSRVSIQEVRGSAQATLVKEDAISEQALERRLRMEQSIGKWGNNMNKTLPVLYRVFRIVSTLKLEGGESKTASRVEDDACSE